MSRDDQAMPTVQKLMGTPLSAEEAAFMQREIRHYAGLMAQVKAEVGTEVFGQDSLLDDVMTCACAGGNLLLEGSIGRAKTRLVSRLTKALGLGFKRVQYNPEVMPSDIIGQEISNRKSGAFEFQKGPVFTQVLFADELNRGSERVQSATLQVMEEHEVTVGTETYHVPRPFMLFATQNPKSQIGTNLLPEATRDRFMMRRLVGKMDWASQKRMLVEETSGREDIRTVFDRARNHGADLTQEPNPRKASRVRAVLGRNDLILIQTLVERMPLTEDVANLIIRVVNRLDPEQEGAPEYLKVVEEGPSPRSAIAFGMLVKARALIRGDVEPHPDDVLALLDPALAHRIYPKHSRNPEKTVQEVLAALRAEWKDLLSPSARPSAAKMFPRPHPA